MGILVNKFESFGSTKAVVLRQQGIRAPS